MFSFLDEGFMFGSIGCINVFLTVPMYVEGNAEAQQHLLAAVSIHHPQMHQSLEALQQRG